MTDTLSPKRRFLSGLFGGREGNWVSVGNPTSIVCQELMDKSGIHFPHAHTDAGAMAGLAAAGHTIVGFDTIMPEFSVQQEAAALGCEVDWGDDNMMPDTRTHPVRELKDITIPRAILEKPSMKVVLDALAILRREYGDRVALLGKVMGPWTISYHLVGTEEFLTWTILAPDKLREFLDRLKGISIQYARAQLQAGADVVVLADHATGDLLSPDTYEHFLLPIHKEIIQEIGAPIILHVCGNCLDRLHLFAEAGFDAYHFEWQVDAREAVRRVNGKMSLIGNVDNAKTLLRGTPEQVYEQARYAIDAGVEIVSPECCIPLSTPLANLQAIVAAARQGRGCS
jgi:[methyl-Co(III) methanol-specific corrinoid protein]:coenzyme M methyltransferase